MKQHVLLAERRMRLRMRLALVCVSLAGVIGCGIFHSPDPLSRGWGPPYLEPGTLGPAVEKQFGLMLQDCHISSLDDKQVRTSVPLVLQEDMGDKFTFHVLQLDDESSSDLFRQVFRDTTKTFLEAPSINDLLDEALVPLSTVPQPAPGASSILFGETCASVLNDAIGAKLDLKVATLQGGIQSQYEDHTELALAEGRFFSPLALLLLPSSPRAQRARALLGIFMWYVGRPSDTLLNDRAKNKFYYIGGFTGLGLYTIRRASASRSTELNADFQAKYGVASVTAALRDSMFRSGDINVERYETDIFFQPSSDSAHLLPDTIQAADRCRRRDMGDKTIAYVSCIADGRIYSLSRLTYAAREAAGPQVRSNIEWAWLPSPHSVVAEWETLMESQDTTIAMTLNPDSAMDVPFAYTMNEMPRFACETAKWRVSSSASIVITNFRMSGDSTCIATGRVRLTAGFADDTASAQAAPGYNVPSDVLLWSTDGITADSQQRAGLIGSEHDSIFLTRQIPIAIRLAEDPDVSVASLIGPTKASSKALKWQLTVHIGGTKRIVWQKKTLPDLQVARSFCASPDSSLLKRGLPLYATPDSADSVARVVRYTLTWTGTQSQVKSTSQCRISTDIRIPVTDANGVKLSAPRRVPLTLVFSSTS